jgi:hypothetical protein
MIIADFVSQSKNTNESNLNLKDSYENNDININKLSNSQNLKPGFKITSLSSNLILRKNSNLNNKGLTKSSIKNSILTNLSKGSLISNYNSVSVTSNNLTNSSVIANMSKIKK